MPLDPQAQVIVDAMETLGRAPANESTPDEYRAVVNAAPLVPGPEVASVENRTIPGPLGDIPVRIYTPAGVGPHPILVYFHGGGWVIGTLDGGWDATVRNLVDKAGCLAISVDYRLAPENKFPAAAEDCYAATKWAAHNAASLNADAARIAVAGDSAGGNLSAVVALLCRDRGGPELVHQIMAYPVIDNDFTNASYTRRANGPVLTKASMEWFWNHYMRNEDDANNPYAAPIRAKDLSGLAPALVITAEFDPLHDEGVAYAKRLEEAGVPTVHADYDGMIHGFFTMGHVIDKGAHALNLAADALKKSFGT